MNKKILVSILCALVVLLAFSGCKKEEAAPAEKPAAEAPAADAAAPAADAAAPAADAAAPAADAAAPAADAAAPAADAAAPDLKTAAKNTVTFFEGMNKIAEESGENCDEMGTKLLDHLNNNKDTFIAAMKVLANLKEGTPEADSVKEEMAAMEKISGDDSAFSKAASKCESNEKVQGFSLAFLGVIMQAAPAAPDMPEADAPDAPAADAPAPAADAPAPAADAPAPAADAPAAK